jgi:phytoene dehydrogenase-like protein
MSRKDMSKSIIIIGAGIAGLAAGCYGQMNGYRTQIFELHNLPGGLCTAWERKGYIFDGCIHYLFGSAPGKPFHQVWEELGAVQGRQFVNHEEFMRIRTPDGKTLIIYSDPDRLEAHMKELSPADSGLIEDFAQGIRKFTTFDMSILKEQPKELMGLDGWRRLGMKMLPYMGPVLKLGLLSAQDFASRFKDPFLRRSIAQMFAWGEIPMMAGLSQLAAMHIGNAGYPLGASLEFARAIERRYLELGGEIHYSSQVERILYEDDPHSQGQRAVGVRLYNDDEYRADYVISAADGHSTIFEMLEGKFLNRKIERLYDGHLPLYSQAQISLGVNRDMSPEPHWITYLLDEPLLIAGQDHPTVSVKHYCFDPNLAPPGKSAVIVMMRTRYGYWQRIYGHRLYDSEQSQVSDIVIDFLDKIYPGIHQQIEFIDEATPLSYERYTGNWQGSSCGWLLTKDTMLSLILGMDKTLPGLNNFLMAGQWVEPGGTVSMAAMSGRNAIQSICHRESQPFVASKPG